MCEFLRGKLEQAGVPPGQLRVFDLGAGNGIMGEELAKLGVDCVVGADILPEAAAAAERDRPDVYRGYHVADLTALTDGQRTELDSYGFNAMTCIAALGFGDIPTECFRTAYNLLDEGGWVILNIKEDFLADSDTTGFAGMLHRAIDSGALEVVDTTLYQHRLATNGSPLNYTAMIARKRSDL
ncbi:MAG TPA: methyltransferase domain-containing protein [Pseudonocardia sp.]